MNKKYCQIFNDHFLRGLRSYVIAANVDNFIFIFFRHHHFRINLYNPHKSHLSDLNYHRLIKIYFLLDQAPSKKKNINVNSILFATIPVKFQNTKKKKRSIKTTPDEKEIPVSGKCWKTNRLISQHFSLEHINSQ